MSSGSSRIADRLLVTRLIAGRGVAQGWRLMCAPVRLLTQLGAQAPERLLIAPQDIRTTDPTIASDIYSGYFVFAGKSVNTHGQSPFEIAPPSEAWFASLTSFSWLRHLRAADSALARANARALVGDWIQLRGRPNGAQDWQAGIAARRLLAFLSQSPLILDGADRDFYRLFMRSLGVHSKYLQRCLSDGLEGETRLTCAIAIAELGLCAQGLNSLARRGTKLLVDELKMQILPDGGHIGRNPQSIVDLLLDLLPLRQAYAARGTSAPQMLLNVIDRMMPMLRLFRHGDGSIALFNGMGPTAAHGVATVLAYDDARAAPLAHAPHSGYERMEAGDTVIIADFGAPPPRSYSCDAHAGTLSFEMSSGANRIFINCGVPSSARADLRDAARATAAHTALVVGDTSSARFASGAGLDRFVAGQMIAGPTDVRMRRAQDEHAVEIEGTHNGYDRSFGLLHERRMTLSADGLRLEGEDKLVATNRSIPGSGQADYALRFHLHPSARAELMEGGTAALLTLPDDTRWLFRASGLAVAIEESIFLGGREGPRQTDQLVVSAKVREVPAAVWTMEKLQ